MSKTVQGRNGAHSKASKRRKKQKNRLIIVVIEILVLLILAAVLFVTVKLSKIQKDTSFNKEDIEVNEGLSSESQEIMAGYTTIALFGLDNRSNGNLSKGNSDVIMIASINNDTHAVKLVSVYRDSYLDIGGGTSDIAVISLDGVVVSSSIKVAGDDFDDAIVRFMRKRHNLLIGERSAEEIKINIGTCYKRPENISMDIRGRNLVTGLPKTVTVSSDETEEALREVTSQIVDAVHSVLERTPPELAADIADRGIELTGGGALLHGLEDLIEENTGITTMTAEEPLTAVAIGTGKYIEFLSERK